MFCCERRFVTFRGLNQHLRFCLTKSTGIENIIQSSQPVLDESRKDSNVTNSSYDQTNQHPSFVNDLHRQISEAYEAMVTWRKNIFELPKGNVGKLYVKEMNRLVTAWCTRSNIRIYALKGN